MTDEGFASFMIVLAQRPPDQAQGAGAAFDQDAWNASEVASRAGKSVAELMEELRSSSERSVAACSDRRCDWARNNGSD